MDRLLPVTELAYVLAKSGRICWSSLPIEAGTDEHFVLGLRDGQSSLEEIAHRLSDDSPTQYPT